MRRRNVVALGVLVVIAAIIGIYQTPIMTQARGKTWDAILMGVSRVFSIDGVQSDDSVVRTVERLRAENTRLKAQLNDYRRLREQIGSPSFESHRTIPAFIASRPIDTFQSEFVLNKGTVDGVELNAPVVVNGSVLVGFVSDLREHSSVMRSVLHPSTHLTAETVTDDEEMPAARGLIESRYYTSLVLATVPRDVPLEEGQSVVSVKKDTQIPYGLVLGTVSRVFNLEHEPYQEARIKVPYDIDTIDAVHIIASP